MSRQTLDGVVNLLPQRVTNRLKLSRCRWKRRRPRTFNEKLLYKMVWDRRPILVTYADKVAAADYIAQRIGRRHLPERYAITDDFASIDPGLLPTNFVMKNSHLSGGVVVVFDRANPEDVYARRAIRPENLDWNRLGDVSAAWMSTTYVNALHPCAEWMYGRIPRRIVVEELLLGRDGALPDDLRFYVFNGTCRIVRSARGVVGGAKTIDEFRPDWTPIDVDYFDGVPIARSATPPPKPERLSEMIELAEALAWETDFLRVDMFDVPDRIMVGELTSFPSAANGRWDPPGLDLELGDHWRLPRRYRGSL